MVIDDGLFLVKNEQFRLEFGKLFDSKYQIEKQQDMFKDINRSGNPLLKLIDLYHRRHPDQSILVCDLIQLICEKIEITKEELLNDTLYQPARSTLTYPILFDQSLKTLPIYKTTISQLESIWKTWDEEGFLVRQIDEWSALEKNEKQLVGEIWKLVGQCSKRPIELQQLLNEAKAKIEEIRETIGNVSLCIENFCQDAYDQKDYSTHIREAQEEINQATTISVSIPTKIVALKPFADRIISLTSSAVWQQYVESKLLFSLI